MKMGNTEKMREIIFVASAAYSGSTMLDLMLSNSDVGFSCGEVSALFRPWRPNHLHPECGCRDPDCDVWHRIRKYGERRVYHGIFTEFPHLEYVVDSSKDVAWLQDQHRYRSQTALEARCVLLWKSPLEYAYSCWKRGRSNNWVRRWVSYYRRFLSVTPHWLSVPYRDLARFPAETLRELCAALDIDYHPGKEHFWERPQHTLWGSDSVKLHFLEPGTEDYLGAAQRRAQSQPNVDPRAANEIRHHREIYYNGSYQQKLPERIRREAEESTEMGQLVTLLQETDFRAVPDPARVSGLSNDLRPSPLWYWRDRAIDRVLELAARAGVRII
jgi:hypothetical protein